MTDVTIKGGRTRENAINLLAAADVLDLPREVVRVTMNGFIVPEEVAKKAGFDPEVSAVTSPGPSEPPPDKPLPEGDREVVETQRATASTPVPSEAPEPTEKASRKAPAKKAPAKKAPAKKTAAASKE